MDSTAANITSAVLAGRDRFFKPSDFEGSRDAVEHAFRRMVRGGDLLRIRRGLYWRGRPSRFGMTPPAPAVLGLEVAGVAGSGPAGWSAAAALGVSHQLPARETVAVPARAPIAPDRVEFVSRAARHARREERLKPKEVALLEVLECWERLVEVSDEDAARRLRDIVTAGAVRPAKLAGASRDETGKTRKRLKDLLTTTGHTAEADAIGWITPEIELSATIPALAMAS